MLKRAFRSYLSSLHPRNFKKLTNNNGGFWLFYWVFIYPLIVSGSNPNFPHFMWFTMIKMFPFFLMGWSSMSSRFLMPKAMFLCPMKEEDRREYINAVLVMKIGFPVLVGIVIELLFSLYYGFKPLQIIAIAFVHFSVGIAMHICFEGKGKNDQIISQARIDKNGKTRWAWMNVVLMIWAILLLAGFEVIDMTSAMDWWSGIAIGVSLVAFVIFDIAIVATQYRDTIVQAGNYELTFHVLSKVPTNETIEFDLFKK